MLHSNLNGSLLFVTYWGPSSGALIDTAGYLGCDYTQIRGCSPLCSKNKSIKKSPKHSTHTEVWPEAVQTKINQLSPVSSIIKT